MQIKQIETIFTHSHSLAKTHTEHTHTHTLSTRWLNPRRLLNEMHIHVLAAVLGTPVAEMTCSQLQKISLHEISLNKSESDMFN